MGEKPIYELITESDRAVNIIRNYNNYYYLIEEGRLKLMN